MRSLFRIFLYVALLAVPLLAASLWLDAHGETATATVTGKREEIHVDNEPTGGWSSRRFLVVDFPRLAASGLQASVRVDSVEFQSYHAGDRVSIRYFPCCPIFARLAGRTTRQVTWEAVREFGSSPLLDWVIVGTVALVLAAQVSSVLVAGVGAVWLAAGVLFLFPVRPPRVAEGTKATARVAGISEVTESPPRSSRRSRSSSHPERLRVPYQVVQLRFVPAGGSDSVLAVDEVDAGSVPSLGPGVELPIRYQPAAPREAMLVDGTRTFRQRNRFHFVLPTLGLPAIGVAAGLAWRIRGRRKAAAT